MTDPGVKDKRLLVMESEFARTLKAADRDCNTLSAVIRLSWDSGDLRVMTKSKNARVTAGHVGIVAHITREELSKLLTTTEAANGFANRFLWIHSERSKELPFGGSLKDEDLMPIANRLRQIKDYAEIAERIEFAEDAKPVWESVYGPLSSGKPGLFGSVIGRAEAQARRLALLYALLDGDTEIRLPHLEAALAVWDYTEQSARYIFGDALGDDTTDSILDYLRTVGAAGATRTDISHLFDRNKAASEIGRALMRLVEASLARMEREQPQGKGRPIERWFAGRKP